MTGITWDNCPHLTISRASLVKLNVFERMSMLVALSSLSLRSVEMLNCIWSPSKSVTLDLVSFSPKGSSLSENPIRALIRPGSGSFYGNTKQKLVKVLAMFWITVLCFSLSQSLLKCIQIQLAIYLPGFWWGPWEWPSQQCLQTAQCWYPQIWLFPGEAASHPWLPLYPMATRT